MAEYEITMTRSPNLSDDEVSRRLAQVYSLLIALGRQANGDTPAESAGTGAVGSAAVTRPQHATSPVPDLADRRSRSMAQEEPLARRSPQLAE